MNTKPFTRLIKPALIVGAIYITYWLLSLGAGATDSEQTLPSKDEFVRVETIAELIHYATPRYPRKAEQAGQQGLVWIKALVGSDGSIRKAVVYKTSGTPSLDNAALKAAYDNKFNPAVQDGKPIAMWVTYKVEFKLDRR